jgi:hypothetical protein
MFTLVLLLLAAGSDWKVESTRDGVTLESRPVEGSSFYEYRGSAEATASVDALCDGVFEWASTGTDHPHLTSRKVLEDHGDSRIVHDTLDPPVVSKRELTFTVTRKRLADGACFIEYHAQNDKAPKTADGFVRIEKLNGSWRFDALPTGKTRVTYMLFADPGGSIPAIFVHPTQRDAIIQTVKHGATKARK